MTRVLAFSDMHLSRRCAEDICAAAADADLVIGVGDFCAQRRGLDDAMAMLAPVLPKAVLIPGNAESADELRAAADPATVLHGEAAERAGLRLFGLGYAVPRTPFGAWSCDLDEDEAEALLGRMRPADGAPDGAPDILIVHSPPKGVADRTSGGALVGSTAVRAAIERCRPRLVLCGHIHDSWGASGTIGASRVHNLGPRPSWFEL
jgi:uncharacterized protein